MAHFVVCTICINAQNENSKKETVYDIDSNSYKVERIGTQHWFIENLTVKRFNNGDSIPMIKENTSWASLLSIGYCDYKHDTSISKIYGKLYNFYVVIDKRGVCPVGWHVPNYDDWKTLIDYLGANTNSIKKIKESGSSHWIKNNDGDNSSKFTGLPSGFRDERGGFGGLGTIAGWWTSKDDYSFGKCVLIAPYFSNIKTTDSKKQFGYSIRCIKD